MSKLRSGLEIKKAIIKSLKDSELSLSMLERKINTNNETILIHCKELEYFGIVEIIHHEKSKINGRPYKTVKLIEYGKKFN